MDKKIHGFTLIELLVAVAVLAILLTLAAPSFQELIRSNRVRAITDEMLTVLNTARAEAVKRNIPVTICTSSDSIACDNGANWENGWVMFADADADGALDAGEVTVHVGGAAAINYTVRGGGNFVNRISFRPDGSTTLAGTLRICSDAADATRGRGITLNRSGRARTYLDLTAGNLQCP